MILISQFRKRLVVSSAAMALAVTALFSPAAQAADDVIKWKVQSHWPGSSTSYQDSLVRIKKVLEERTDGRLQLQLFEADALFKAQETFNAVSRGIIQMGTISPGYAQDKLTLAGVASGLPFAFHHVWEAVYFHKNMGFEDMLREEAAKYNVYYSTDKIYPTEMVLKKPVESWSDFTGLKIRSSGALQKFLSDAGASGTYVPGGELYQALSSGVVDGAHWGASQGADSMGLYEVAKYHVKPALNIAGTDVFIVSQKALDALPDGMAKIVKDSLEEQFWVRTNQYQYEEEISLAKVVREQGVKVNTLPEDVQEKLFDAAQKTWDAEAKRSDNAAESVKQLRKFLTDLGYI